MEIQENDIRIDLPYFLFGDEFPVHIYAFEVDASNEEKRLRVFGGQLTDTVVDNTSLRNFNWNIGIFFKFGGRLIKKYPHREIELNQMMMDFWRRMQIRYKELQNNK